MKLYGNALVPVVDGTKARLFDERRRAGPLLDITGRQPGEIRAASLQKRSRRPTV